MQVAAATLGLPDRGLHQRPGQTRGLIVQQRLGVAQVLGDGGKQARQPIDPRVIEAIVAWLGEL